VLSAIAYWYVRRLGQLGEPEWRTVFYFALAGTVLGLGGTLLLGFSAHTPRGIALLFGVGITATLAQLAMTRAYAYGHTLVVANLQFAAVVMATLLGIVVFGDHIPLLGWLGIAVIIASGVMSTVLIARHRATLAATTSAPKA
jgi:S-adenosylmethionine uptake transporter